MDTHTGVHRRSHGRGHNVTMEVIKHTVAKAWQLGFIHTLGETIRITAKGGGTAPLRKEDWTNKDTITVFNGRGVIYVRDV